MSRKDYIAIAAAIRSIDADYKGIHAIVCSEIAEQIADVFAADNSRFDRERFLAAARYEEPTEGLTYEQRDAAITKAIGIEPGETRRIEI